MDGPYLDGLPPGSSYPASAALSYTLPPSATVDIADLDDAFIVSQSQLSQSSLSAKEWSHEVCPALMNNAGSGSMPVSPPVSNDDFDSSNYHASSTTLAGTEPPFSFLASPRSCSESDLFQWIDQNQVQSRSLTPLSLDGSPASQDVITSHHTGFTSDPSVTGRADPRGLSPRSSTAASRPPVTHAGDPFETTMSPASVDDEHEGKADPPYAQLIYEFFMNHGDPRRGVPLRAIYDYFREHTTKCSNGGKGWQNSIRHNLSMNEAFVKADKVRGRTSSGAAELDQPEKSKSTEWMLTEEAIRNGIESTTRYRPKERPKARQPTKRAGTPSSTTAKTSLDQKTPPNRAASGRRGGLSNSRSAKAAAAERKRIRQQQEQTSQLHLFMKAQLQYQGSSGQPPQQQLALQQRPGMPFDHSYHPQMAGFPPAGEASDLGPFSLSGHFTLSPTSANHPAAASNKACPTYDDGAAAAYQYDDQSTLTTGGGSALDPTFLLEDVSVGRTVLPYMYGQQTDSPVAASTSITPEPSTDYMTDAMYTPRSWSQSAY